MFLAGCRIQDARLRIKKLVNKTLWDLRWVEWLQYSYIANRGSCIVDHASCIMHRVSEGAYEFIGCGFSCT